MLNKNDVKRNMHKGIFTHISFSSVFV